MLRRNDAIQFLNELGKSRTPFDFYCDFLGDQWVINQHQFQLSITHEPIGISNGSNNQLEKSPISFEAFKKSFDLVVNEIKYGNSFLANLTFKTPIQTGLSLTQIFHSTQAKYKVLVPNEFVVFSPETFVKTQQNQIFSYPMKGTIDASLPNAEEEILADQKEIAEHVTIVDLIRNDLSRVAKNVLVNKFRYIDKIKTHGKDLLQVSSEIVGDLPALWQSHLGDILTQILPAGSISGAPKQKTIEIIKNAETYDRGWYTGICGRFDGENLDSGVMIRFIKKEDGKLFYCSGGGITAFSEPKKEYDEMIDKIYLP